MNLKIFFKNIFCRKNELKKNIFLKNFVKLFWRKFFKNFFWWKKSVYLEDEKSPYIWGIYYIAYLGLSMLKILIKCHDARGYITSGWNIFRNSVSGWNLEKNEILKGLKKMKFWKFDKKYILKKVFQNIDWFFQNFENLIKKYIL